MDRREFLKHAAVVGTAPALTSPLQAEQRSAVSPNDRDVWVAIMRRLADPVLTNAANGTLKARMPVEQALRPGSGQAAGADRRPVTHLEAIGRLLAGIAPWIELGEDSSAEGRLRAHYA